MGYSADKPVLRYTVSLNQGSKCETLHWSSLFRNIMFNLYVVKFYLIDK